MSLLNEVMRDLQTRGVLGMPPLAGLHPVADVSQSQHKRHRLWPVLGALMVVAAVVLWRPVSSGEWASPFAWLTGAAPGEPDADAQAVVAQPAESRPAVVATGKHLRELFDIETSLRRARILRDIAAYSAASVTVAEANDSPSTIVDLPALEAQPIAASHNVSALIADETDIRDTGTARTTILRREPGIGDIDGIMMRAQRAMRAHDLVTAERLIREALVIDASDVTTWTYLYSVLVGAARPAAAEQALRQGLSQAVEPAALAKLYAKLLVDRGDKEGAVSVLSTHRPAPARDTEYDAFLGALLQQTGSYAEAGDVYRSLLAVDPDSGPWLTGLAMSDDSLGNASQALAGFERALESGSLKSPLDRYARRRIAELQAYE